MTERKERITKFSACSSASRRFSANRAATARLKASWIVLTALVTILCGCQNSPPQSVRFDTLITDDDVKRFQLTFEQPARVLQLPRRGDGNQQQPRAPSEEYMRATLQRILEDNNYCRQGHLVFGRSAGQTSYRLRGECRDPASAADRQRFADTIDSW